MRFLPFALALPVWLGSATPTQAQGLGGQATHPLVSDVDVAIIGGGSSGIHAAIQLKDAGASVLVLEKKGQIGGHAETYVNKETGVVNNIGVILFENIDLVRRYFTRLGVPMTTARMGPFSSQAAPETWDFALGIRIPPPDADEREKQRQAVEAAVRAYTEDVLSRYGWVESGYFLPDPVPEELSMPYADFAAKYNFTALLPIVAMFNWYFGNLTTVPALYGIKDFGPGLVNSVFGEFIVSATGDTRSLYDAALTELGPAVLLNSTILAVNRRTDGGGVSLLVSQPGREPETVRAKKLLVAIPPALENLQPAFDLSDGERALFSKFSALGCLTGVASVPGWNSRTLFNAGAFTPFHQPVIPGANVFFATGTPDELTFAVGFDTDRATGEAGEAVVRAHLATLAAAGAVPPDAARTVAFPATSFHGPFNLRVGAREIRGGFYADLLALQGASNTYWTGAAWAGHNSALVWNFNEGTVIPGLKKDLGLE